MADHMVPQNDFYDALRVFGSKFDLWPPLGLPLIHDPQENWITYWCTVNPDPPSGVPTIFQLIAPTGPGWVQGALEEQGNRPNKYHNVNFRVPDFNVLLENLARRNVPHRVEDSFNIVKGRRLFIGRSREDHLFYDGSHDLNLRLEAVEPGFRIQGYGSRSDRDRWQTDRPAQPWGYVKILSRSVVVDDVVGAVEKLGLNFFLWPRPDTGIIDVKRDGVRRVEVPTEPSGLDVFLDVMEPYDDSKRAGKWFKEWGVGPWAITFQVHDLKARLDLFDERGVRYEVEERDDEVPYTRAYINPDDAYGAVFIYVDLKS